MKANMFFLLLILTALIAFISPVFSGILTTILLIVWFRKEQEKKFDPEAARQECIGVFQGFISAIYQKDKLMQEKMCLNTYELEKVPAKILEANLISSSPEQVEMNFTLLSVHGEILNNNVVFIPIKFKWLIKEIK
jgi:hypothetical protein